MGSSIYKMGFWASLLQSIVGYLYLIFYIVFTVLYPPLTWTNIQDFALNYHGAYATILIVLQVLAWIQSFLFFTIGVLLSQFVSPKKKAIVTIGLGCSVVFLALSSIHYYIQLTSVRIGIEKGLLEGLGQFVQFNFDSPISVINILGWTLFCGIACIAFAFCFKKSRRGKWLKYGFLLNGIVSVLTAILFACGLTWTMLIWTFFISLTWYVYPILTLCFKRKNLDVVD